MRCHLSICLSLSVAAGGCQTLKRPPQTPEESLGLAAELLKEGDAAEAILTLDHFGNPLLSLEDKAHWYLLAGTAQHRIGESWAAFTTMREFIRENHFLDKTYALANLTYDIGEYLAQSDASFGIFYSDRRRGKSVLTDFVSLYSNNEHMPDALHRLGEIAYEDENYELARERFTQIITGGYQNSVWNTKAAFRVAMCYFRRLEGADYDLAEMKKAMVELTDFIESEVENPKFLDEARIALRTVRSWLAEKHASIAEFYLTLGNRQGGLHHLHIAATTFPETAAAKDAKRRLDALRRDGTPPAKSSAKPANGGDGA